MKKTLSALSFFLVCCVLFSCSFSLVSCKGGIDTDEAKAFIGDFLDAVEAEDFESAKTFLHPDRPVDLESFFLRFEQREELDLGSGIEVLKITGMSYAYYDSSIGGSSYELTMRTEIGGKPVEIRIEIVQNENGYGIYNLNLDT